MGQSLERMMKNATVLTLLDETTQPENLDALIQAARDDGMHVSVLVLGRMPRAFPYSRIVGDSGGVTRLEEVSADVKQARARLTESASAVQTYLEGELIDYDVRILLAGLTCMAETIATRSMACDMIVVAETLTDHRVLLEVIVRAALFRSPAPVLLNGMRVPAALRPESILIGWHPSLPAARVVHATLPMLLAAKQVTLGVIDPAARSQSAQESSASDMARWLSHHGCKVDIQRWPSAGAEIGEVLIQRFQEMAANLLISGAYDHSHWRELVFGGATRTLIGQPELPILLAH